MKARRKEAAWVGAAAVAVAAARFATRARVPDSYDGIGFLRAIDRFDLKALAPHFPGYPLYVGLERAAHALGLPPLDAATAVSAVMAGATLVAVSRLGRALGGRAAGFGAAGLYACASLPWLLGGAALPESTAVCAGAWAFALLVSDGESASRPTLGALFAGLMLGARPDYAPLALSWLLFAWLDRRLDRAALSRALGAFLAGTLAWLVPLLAIVGPAELVALGRVHLAGHFAVWGGTVATRPRPGARLFDFARDLLFDGIAPEPALLAILGLVSAVAAWRVGRRDRRSLRAIAILAAPYGLWVLLGQNVAEQPRHLLPLVVLLLVGLGALLARDKWLLAGALVVTLGASLPLAVLRARTEPAALKAARWVKRTYAPREVVVFGGRSLRFFEWAAPEVPIRTRTWLSEVDVELARLDVLPPYIYVTDEVEPDPARARRLGDAVTFCRDPRLDREAPCLSLRRYEIGAVP